MIDMKHTVGPWTFGNTGPEQVMILGGNGKYVCNVQIWQTPRNYGVHDEAERAANASLIAAAPDLLAALEAVVHHGYLKDDDLWKTCRAAVQRAKAGAA